MFTLTDRALFQDTEHPNITLFTTDPKLQNSPQWLSRRVLDPGQDQDHGPCQRYLLPQLSSVPPGLLALFPLPDRAQPQTGTIS